MNKEISVQYAYKKDGKGERHGDEAERMLAAQARKHNVQPTTQPLPPQLFSQPTPNGPSSMMNGGVGPPSTPGGYMSNGNYQNVPPLQPPPRPSNQTPLPPPPSGLPARPPPSQAGYGGPASMLPPGFAGGPPMGGQMGGFQQPGQPQPPMGFGPPPGFGPPAMGPPPGMPPGFHQQPYGQQAYGGR